MSMQPPALFKGKMPGSAKRQVPAELPPLDLGGLKPPAALPSVDPAALDQISERHGFSDRDKTEPQVGGGEGQASPQPSKLEPAPRSDPAPAATVAVRRAIPRSGRKIPINLKATPDYQARFLALCDRLTEREGRGITQAEGFEMAVAALEREMAGARDD